MHAVTLGSGVFGLGQLGTGAKEQISVYINAGGGNASGASMHAHILSG
jgi:hypothetical protein